MAKLIESNATIMESKMNLESITLLEDFSSDLLACISRLPTPYCGDDNFKLGKSTRGSMENELESFYVTSFRISCEVFNKVTNTYGECIFAISVTKVLMESNRRWRFFFT